MRIFLLELGIDAEREFRGISDFENRVGFEQSAGKKEAEECQEPGGEEGSNSDPNQAAAPAIDVGIRRAGVGDSPAEAAAFEVPTGGRAHVFRGIRRARVPAAAGFAASGSDSGSVDPLTDLARHRHEYFLLLIDDLVPNLKPRLPTYIRRRRTPRVAMHQGGTKE